MEMKKKTFQRKEEKMKINRLSRRKHTKKIAQIKFEESSDMGKKKDFRQVFEEVETPKYRSLRLDF
jgi:hypothetical protein